MDVLKPLVQGIIFLVAVVFFLVAGLRRPSPHFGWLGAAAVVSVLSWNAFAAVE